MDLQELNFSENVKLKEDVSDSVLMDGAILFLNFIKFFDTILKSLLIVGLSCDSIELFNDGKVQTSLSLLVPLELAKCKLSKNR